MHRVTVLIACYNDEEFIGGAIKSALEQNYTGPVTVCVIDDGSTDSSSEIAKSHFTKPINDCEPITVLGATFEDCCITFQENMGKFGTTKYIVIEKRSIKILK